MAMAISVPRYTLADLERFPDDGNRYELLDGVLIVTPSPSNAHQIIVNRLQFRLTQATMLPGHHRSWVQESSRCLHGRNCSLTFSFTQRVTPSIRSGKRSTSIGSPWRY